MVSISYDYSWSQPGNIICTTDGTSVAGTSKARGVTQIRDQIISEVCEKHGIPYDVILWTTRVRPVVLARHELMYRLRRELMLSYPQIAKRVGVKDHSTVIHGVKAHEERMKRGEAK